MFFKNKPEKQPPENAQPRSLPGGQSLFAPGLNPAPSHLVFEQPSLAMPSMNWETPLEAGNAFSPDEIPMPPPLQWEPALPPVETVSHPIPEAVAEPIFPEVAQTWESTPMPAPPADNDLLAWTPPIESVQEFVPEATSFEESALMPEPVWASPVPEELPPLPPELYQPAQEISIMENSSWDAFETNTLDPGVASGGYVTPAIPEEMAPLPWDASTAQQDLESMMSLSPAADHAGDNAWSTWDTPSLTGIPEEGEEPLNPGAFLDTVNQQLYPEDPFVDPMLAMEGAQAFEEAAQFLFPETVSAAPDWQPEEPLSAWHEDPFATGFSEVNPLELGPSYQPEPGNLNDLSAMAATETADAGTFLDPYDASSVTPVSEPPDFGLPELSGLSAHQTILSDPALSAAYEVGDEGPELPVSEGLSAAFDDAYAFTEQETVIPGSAGADWPTSFPETWGQEIEPDLPEGIYIPPESVDTDYLAGAQWIPGMVPEQPNEIEPLVSPIEPEASVPQSPPLPREGSLEAFLSDDADFYASSFTLTEHGDLIPAYEQNPGPAPAAADKVLPAPNISFEQSMQAIPGLNDSIQPLPPENTFPEPTTITTETALFPETPVEPTVFLEPESFPQQGLMQEQANWTAPAADYDVEAAFGSMGAQEQQFTPEPVFMEPDNFGQPSVQEETQWEAPAPTVGLPDATVWGTDAQEQQLTPEPVFMEPDNFGQPLVREETHWESTPATATGSAEALWESSGVSAAESHLETTAPALSMDQLEILGVCQLTQDKRLLLVHSNGQFALMGQAGQENPNVSVLKIFENNPVAYQQTFAAAQEGQAGEQGMFVTQVGTWHAIVSTFRDQIVLHTELG